MWERAIRRTRLPLAYKQGFNPQPHMQFAAPLGVGFSGSREIMDFRLDSVLPTAMIAERLTQALPQGVGVLQLFPVELKSDPLQASLLGADYSLLVQAPRIPDGADRAERFLAKSEIWRKRQRKGREYTYNLRPLVHELSYEGPAEDGLNQAFSLRVQMLEGATGRPDEVLAEMGLDTFAHLLHRERLYFSTSREDAAVFSHYSLARQEDVASSADKAARQRRRRRGKGKKRPSNQQAQAFGEKAADEFD